MSEGVVPEFDEDRRMVGEGGAEFGLDWAALFGESPVVVGVGASWGLVECDPTSLVRRGGR